MPAPAPIRVLLVDDHKTMLWGLQKLLENEAGVEVVGAASDSAQALEQCARLRPDVVLLDLDLGGQSSIDILPRLLANGVTRALVLTGTREQATLDQAVMAGARGLLGKEGSAEQIVQALRKVHAGELCVDQAILGRVLGGLLNSKPAPKADPDQARIATLTPKERKIIAMVVEGNGATSKALAERAFIAENTLRNHLTTIYQKLEVANRLELYVYALRHGLGPPLP